MSILENIQSLCEQRETSVPALERELGFGKGSMYKWTKNSPSIDKVQKVAEYFGVSTDFLLYGFDKSEFTSLVNMARHRRSVEEFAKDTGLDVYYLTRLCSGIVFEQPSIDTVLKIASHNDNDWVVDPESIFKAAGYSLEEISDNLLQNIPLETLHHYQEQGLSAIEMAIKYAKLTEAELKDAMSFDPSYGGDVSGPSNEGSDELSEEQILTLAAHQVGHDGPLTEEQLAQIKLAVKIALAKNDK